MKSAKSNQDEEEYEDEEFSTKREGPSTNNNNKDGKNNDQKASAMRSKHSVTEQRRRSKINERFQMLRDLIPHSDQKRDTASFLLEVIEYVQYLQEKVQKYEGSYQGWSPEPTKLMPWRNSHWRIQNFVGHPQSLKNGSGPGSTFSGRFDENVAFTPSMLTSVQNLAEPDATMDAACKVMDQQPELDNKAIPMPMLFQENMSVPVQNDTAMAHPLQMPVSDAQSIDCPIPSESLNQHDEFMIEGGTINVSSVYSQGLLNTLTEALQNAGVDLSESNISVQIDLGKRANRGLAYSAKDHENPSSSNPGNVQLRDPNSVEDIEQAQKRLKT